LLTLEAAFVFSRSGIEPLSRRDPCGTSPKRRDAAST
jgi:hypothetical protein